MMGEPSNVGDDSPDDEVRPPLPKRPTSEPLLSPSATPVSSSEPLIRRRPPLPPRSSRQSLDKRSYELVDMNVETSKSGSISYNAENDSGTKFMAPRAFRKTHKFFGLDLGYWRMPARHGSIFAIFILVTVIPLYYACLGYDLVQNVQLGAFEYDCYGITAGWTYVGINLRFGRFDFGSAKALDLAWNWVVGRGLQGILTLVAFRVFSDALLRAAEMTPMSYELYAALSLYSNKLAILWQLLKGLGKRGNWRTKAILTWLFISVIYLVLVPSLMDACSGYESSYKGSIVWPNGTMSDVGEIGSWRDNSSVVSLSSMCATWYEDRSVGSEPYPKTNLTTFNMTYPAEYYNTNTSYTRKNEIYAQVYRSCIYNNNDAYAENEIWTVYNWQDAEINKEWWDHFRKDPWTTHLSSSWASWNFFPTRRDRYRCITENNVYQWGFSFEWLFTVAIINSAWLLGLWILWLDCDTNSELCRKGRRLGLWRAVADISEAMREDLGPNLCAYSDQELADALEKRPPLRYYANHGTPDEPGHIGLSSEAPSGPFRLQWNREYGKDDR